MRLLLLLGSLGLLLQQIEAQRSWWSRGYLGHRSRRRDRPRRYRQSEGDLRTHRRHRYRGHQHEEESEADKLRISSHELSRRVSERQRGGGYYPDTRANTSAETVLETTPEYRVETRAGDTIIEFVRSGETQGAIQTR